jgi:hypothetical protein
MLHAALLAHLQALKAVRLIVQGCDLALRRSPRRMPATFSARVTGQDGLTGMHVRLWGVARQEQLRRVCSGGAPTCAASALAASTSCSSAQGPAPPGRPLPSAAARPRYAAMRTREPASSSRSIACAQVAWPFAPASIGCGLAFQGMAEAMHETDDASETQAAFSIPLRANGRS